MRKLLGVMVAVSAISIGNIAVAQSAYPEKPIHVVEAWQQFVEALEDFLPAPQPTSVPGSRFPLDELTPRECEVLELVAQGLDNGTIGTKLGISERTARNHVSIILSKLGISSRAQAMVRAREAGFGGGGDNKV